MQKLRTEIPCPLPRWRQRIVGVVAGIWGPDPDDEDAPKVLMCRLRIETEGLKAAGLYWCCHCPVPKQIKEKIAEGDTLEVSAEVRLPLFFLENPTLLHNPQLLAYHPAPRAISPEIAPSPSGKPDE